VVEGPVSSITKFGAFVTVAEGIEGMVHISEITAEKRLNHPSDVLHVGEIVKAQVLELDQAKRQLRLSIKQMIPTGLDEFIAEHKAGDVVTGRVMEVDSLSNEARVELGDRIVAVCKIPAEDPTDAGTTPPTSGGPVDLSQLGSLLGAKWKTSLAPAKPAGKPAKPVEDKTVKAGQIRSFRLTEVDGESKRIGIELA
jgi:small subunit ribosomal protein S1